MDKKRAVDKAKKIFLRIPEGRENAIQRPSDNSVDRELRELISDANSKGEIIINVGGGIYRPRMEVLAERIECRQYINNELSRCKKLFDKTKKMLEVLNDGSSEQMTMEDFLGW